MRTSSRHRLALVAALLPAACFSSSSTPGNAPDAGFAFDAAGSDAPASAGNVAIAVPGLGNGFDYYQGAYSLGWYFVANASIQVTSLGFYDDKQDGLTESHLVGIYDQATQTLLGSTTVSPSDPLEGYFRYAALTPPVSLTAGSSYVVMSLVGSEKYLAFGSIDPTWTVNPAITFTGDAVNYANTAATTLLYPDTLAPGGGDFGPNFKLGGP